MPLVERIREALPGSLTSDYLKPRMEAGWKPVAVVWEREIQPAEQKAGEPPEEIPFGLKVADDCAHLEENPAEKQALTLMIELIVQDRPLAQVADELNRQGFRTRRGSKWEPAAVFGLMPRLIEVGPRILSSEDWIVRRRRLFQAV
jgi:recombinase